MSNSKKCYVPFTKSEFLQALTDAGLERIEEVESQWTTNRIGVEVCQCKFLARIPGVRGYLSIGSSIDPVSGESNNNACDRITLTLKSLGNKFFRRLNRVHGWRSNLKKAIEKLREKALDSQSSEPIQLPEKLAGVATKRPVAA